MTPWFLHAVLLVNVAGVGEAAHVDARDHPVPGAGRATFERMERALVQGFDDICGDTFCEGEYANLRALQLRCAVRRHDGRVAQCLWSFAGSHARVAGGNPVPVVQAQTYACELPVGEGTTWAWMQQNLVGRDALDTVLPASGRSSYDALTDCL